MSDDRLRRLDALFAERVLGKGPKPRSRERFNADFWKRVDRSDPLGCWNWKGRTDWKGYGVLYFRQERLRAHCVAAELCDLPGDGHLVCHRCNNVACCNPVHRRTVGGRMLTPVPNSYERSSERGLFVTQFGLFGSSERLKEKHVRSELKSDFEKRVTNAVPNENTRPALRGRSLRFGSGYRPVEPAGGLAAFHNAVTTFGPDFLLVDSLSEAFADADFNSSTDVRRMLREAFRPVTVDGRGTVALHHKRKASSNGKPDDDKGSILGSQAFGAAARTVYTLDRVRDDGPEIKGRFVVSLAPQGGWDLETSGSVFVIADNEAGTQTTVDPAQGKKGKAFKTVTATMQAAVRLAELVGSRHTIGRQSAFETVKAELKCSDTTVKGALRLAVERGWMVKGKAEGTTQNEQVLQKGPNSDWEDEL